jgi:hypothetical protein
MPTAKRLLMVRFVGYPELALVLREFLYAFLALMQTGCCMQ